MTDTIFRTEDPECVAAFGKVAAAGKEWAAKVKALLDESGLDYDRGRVTRFPDHEVFTGVSPERGQQPPLGWRKDVKTGEFRPALKTPEGKEIKQRINEIGPLTNLRGAMAKLGMPWIHLSGDGWMRHPAIVLREGVVWVKWGCPMTVEDARWQQVKLSDFYSMTESSSDPFEPALAVADHES